MVRRSRWTWALLLRRHCRVRDHEIEDTSNLSRNINTVGRRYKCLHIECGLWLHVLVKSNANFLLVVLNQYLPGGFVGLDLLSRDDLRVLV